MDNQKFDNQFKIRLFDAETTPPADVWAKVEAELAARRKRRFFAWIFGSSLAVAGVAALLTFSENFSENKQLASVPKTEKQAAAAGFAPQTENSLTKNPGGEILPSAENEISNSIEKPLRGISQISNAENLGPTSENQNTPRNFSARSGKNANRNDAQPLSGYFEKRPESIENQSFIAKPDAPISVSSPVGDKVFNAEKLRKDLAFLPLNLNLVSSAENQPPYRFAPIKPLWRKKREQSHCYDFRKQGFAWLLDGYIGPTFANRQLSATTADFENYASRRNESENFRYGFIGGVRASLVWGPVLLRSGLDYTQFEEKFRHVGPNSTRTITILDSVFVNGNWKVTETKRTEFGDSIHVAYNRFGLLDVPLLAGLEMRFGKAGISLNGGVSANLLFWKRGQILSPISQKPQDFTPGETASQAVFKTKTGLSVLGSAQFFYHLQPRTRVFVEPYFQRVLKPVSVENYPVSQRYNIVGVKLGVTRILGF